MTKEKYSNYLLAGFGGQGILFAGKLLALAGMKKDKYVSWLPAYGPEMRGGTANCSVILDDEPIGSPLVTKPDVLIALNAPSFEKFEPNVVEGGIIIMDSSLVSVRSKRTDITVKCIPATMMASENKLDGLANVIVLGQVIKLTGIFDIDFFEEFIAVETAKKKPALVEFNKKALRLGYNFAE